MKRRLRCGGIFTPDLTMPTTHNGLRTCRCGLVGEPGDAHHPEREVAEDGQMRAAGERSEG